MRLRRGWRDHLERLQPRRLGLRKRITLAYALGAFALAAILSTTTFAFTRSLLIHQRQDTAIRQAYQNARLVQDRLRSNPVGAEQTLKEIQPPSGTNALVHTRGVWIALTAESGRDDIPAPLLVRVDEQFIAAQIITSRQGRIMLITGVPLGLEVTSSYYEIAQLDELSKTLRGVGVSLMGAALITTSFGVLVGAWASKRTVRPLAEAALAAKALAGGRLDTRLDPTEDSDLRSLAEAFNEMANTLQERVERDARFASDVSHELRSPLMTLSASIEVMQARRDEMPERAAAALDLLVADVGRFKGLVEDLLEISRFDAGAVRLHIDEMLVSEFVRRAVAVSSVREAAVSVSDEAESLVIHGDKRRLARAVANLIDNARIHGEGDISVFVEVPEGEGLPIGHVHIAVEDNGSGVTPEERLLIFKRFSRGARSGRRGMGDGAGLGLALVDEHVRLHSGRVWVEDRADGEQGARFVIELPAEVA
jgi:two-component system, OmpR family, sensor histidine kinase MtrB